MNKYDLKIGIFANKFLNFKYETVLKKAGFNYVYTFEEYSEMINKMDILYIEDIHFFETELSKETAVVLLLSSFPDKEEYKKLIESGVKDILFKSADKEEILLNIETISYLKILEIQNTIYQKELQKALTYKDFQEQMALKKQIKIIKDDVSLKKFGNFVVNSFFKPKDILSGDSYLATRIEDKTVFVLADAMGKGLSASISAILSVSFISYKLKTQNYDFEEMVYDTVEYIKTILLEDEALCISFAECENGNMKYANFSLPPLSYKKGNTLHKIKSNNMPITKKTDIRNINILKTFIDFDFLLMYTDGIIETMLDNGELLFMKMNDIIKKHYFLNEVLKEINKFTHKKFDDDVTIFGITNDNFKYEKIYEKEFFFDSKDIDPIIESLNPLNLEKKEIIDLILIEALLNIYEHQDDIDKDSVLKKHERLNELKKVYAKIKILISEKYIKIIIKHKNDSAFNVSELFKEEGIKKYSGRGIFTMNFYADAIAYNNDGSEINVYIRRINEI